MSAPLLKETARRMVEDYLFETYAKEIHEINEKIKAAANKGNYSIVVDADLYSARVYNLFEESGYNIIKIAKTSEGMIMKMAKVNDKDKVMISWRN